MRETYASETKAREKQDGQGMVEYALILVLIAVVVIVVLIVLGNQVLNVFSNISAGLGVWGRSNQSELADSGSSLWPAS